MKKTCYRMIIKLIGVLFILMAVDLPAFADKVPFNAAGSQYEVELPDGWVYYSSDLGAKSPYVQLTGVSVSDMNAYMTPLKCQVIGFEINNSHQLWVSVIDRKDGLGASPLFKDITAYYDGIAISRGPYQIEPHGQANVARFDENPSIFDGGISQYLSIFDGSREIIVRWESGNGKKTEKDIQQLIDILLSVTKTTERP